MSKNENKQKEEKKRIILDFIHASKFKVNIQSVKQCSPPMPDIEIETLKEKQKQSAEDISTLFDALMQKAFKGELVS